jgi:hypothetical protein
MNDEDKAKELIGLGSDIAGSVVGAAVGALGGPGGMVAGAVAGSVITRTARMAIEFAHRSLSHREKVRVGAGLAFAYNKIAQYLEENRHPRSDGFFDQDPSGRSPNDEILEGVLLKCKNEHEEKKTRLLGNIYANIAFMPDVSVEAANWLLQKTQDLTYRQLCILAVVERAKNKGVSWGSNDGDPAFEMEYKQLEEMFARDSSRDAIQLQRETGERRRIIGLSRVGRLCHQVMGLDEIPEDDLRKLSTHFPRAFEQ